MKRTLLWMLVVLICVSMLGVFSFTGCKEEAAPAEEEAAPEEEAVEEEAPAEEAVVEEEEIIADITVWVMPSAASDDEEYYNSLIAKLQEKHPGINVTMETLTWDGYTDKINVAIASGTMADLTMAVGIGGGRGYASKGLLVPVDDIIADMGDTVAASAIEISTLDGEAFIVPVSSNIYSWILNKSLAKELGVMDLIPSDYKSWTYDDFKEFLKAVREAGKEDGIYGTALYAGSQSSDSVTFGMLMSANGRGVFNDEGTEIALNTPESVEMLDYLKSLIDEDLVTPGAATLTDGDIDTLFFSKKIVISITQAFSSIPWMINLLADGELEAPFDATLVEYPSFKGEPVKKVDLGASGWVVFKNKNDEMKIKAAKEFIKVLLTPEFLPSYIERWGGIPVDSSLTLYEDKPIISAEAAKASSWLDDNLVGWNQDKPYWAEIRAVFYPELQAVYSGDKTSQEALDAFAENANAVIAENE